MVDTLPLVDQIWQWLDQVPDPEIPVLSVVDLGVVRNVAYAGERLVITITPTYTGCPATAVIAGDIRRKLRSCGIDNLALKQQLSPAWSTDWLTQKGREKLAAYGIAPPSKAGGPEHCPQCRSIRLERVSQFGSTPCKSQWRCLDCLEPFDYFKCI